MRYYGRRRSSSATRETGGHWISFSDLMSVLVLIFIFIIFNSMLQLQTATESLTAKEDEITEKAAQILQQELQLQAQQAELDSANSELSQAQTSLADKEAALALAEDELEQSRLSLDELTTLIDAANVKLAENEQKLLEQQQQIENIIGVRQQIIQSLGDALARENIEATVDRETGAIRLKSEMMFPSSKSALSGEGKSYIDSFLPVYLNVLLSDEFADYISEIIIEGHTDSSGEYIDNLKLSQNRALSVASYILSDECSYITYAQRRQLRTLVTANGRASAFLIYNESGEENKAASRRVEIKFRLKDEQMISQMEELLENMKESSEETVTLPAPAESNQ